MEKPFVPPLYPPQGQLRYFSLLWAAGALVGMVLWGALLNVQNALCCLVVLVCVFGIWARVRGLVVTFVTLIILGCLAFAIQQLRTGFDLRSSGKIIVGLSCLPMLFEWLKNNPAGGPVPIPASHDSLLLRVPVVEKASFNAHIEKCLKDPVFLAGPVFRTDNPIEELARFLFPTSLAHHLKRPDLVKDIRVEYSKEFSTMMTAGQVGFWVIDLGDKGKPHDESIAEFRFRTGEPVRKVLPVGKAATHHIVNGGVLSFQIPVGIGEPGGVEAVRLRNAGWYVAVMSF